MVLFFLKKIFILIYYKKFQILTIKSNHFRFRLLQHTESHVSWYIKFTSYPPPSLISDINVSSFFITIFYNWYHCSWVFLCFSILTKHSTKLFTHIMVYTQMTWGEANINSETSLALFRLLARRETVYIMNNWAATPIYYSTVKLQCLEHLRNHENMFKQGKFKLMSVNYSTRSGGIIGISFSFSLTRRYVVCTH